MNILGLGDYESDEDDNDTALEGLKDVGSKEVSTENSLLVDIRDPGAILVDEKATELESAIISGIRTKKANSTANVNSSFVHLRELPPSPTASPNPKTVRKICDYLELKEISCFNLTENIRSNKNFGNPYIFGKAVKHFQIDETGSNYPSGIFDPHDYQESDFEAGIKKRYSNVTGSRIVSKAPVKSDLHVMQQPTTMKPASAVEVTKKRSRWDSSSNLDNLAKSSGISSVVSALLPACGKEA